MISKIVMTRVEPCFWGNKQASGEISKVKKNTQNKDVKNPNLNQNGVDTFTSSKDSEKTEVSKGKKE